MEVLREVLAYYARHDAAYASEAEVLLAIGRRVIYTRLVIFCMANHE